MDAEVDYLLSKRVKKISYEVPSTIRKEANIKSQSFYPEKKDARTDRQRRPVTSYIDNFTQKPYVLTKPKRVLVKDRDFLHLLGEVNGTKYDYCSRPELELFVIGVEATGYYQQIHYRDVIMDESSRPRTPHRPQSAAPPPQPSAEEKKDGETVPKDESQPGDEPLNFPQHIVAHKVQSLFYDVKALAGKKTIALLYDPLKSLLIMSEKMEVELVQMLMEMYMDQLIKVVGVGKPRLDLSLREPNSPKTPTTPAEGKARRQSKLGKAKGAGKTRESLLGKGGKSSSQNPLALLPLEESANARPTTPDRQPRPSSPLRPASAQRRPSSAVKKRPTTPSQEQQQSDIESAAEEAATRLLLSNRLTREQLEQALLLLQSYYFIGNQEVVYTMTREKIQLWKRFYATYLLPFFFSFLDSYSFQYSLVQAALAERMHQIEHHIELNQARSILEDSQSEASDNSVASLEKKPKKTKQKNAASLKKKDSERRTVVHSVASSSEDERDKDRALKKKGSERRTLVQPTASSSGDERDKEKEKDLTVGGLVRRNNIKPILIPHHEEEEQQPSGKKLTLLTAGKKSSTASLSTDSH